MLESLAMIMMCLFFASICAIYTQIAIKEKSFGFALLAFFMLIVVIILVIGIVGGY